MEEDNDKPFDVNALIDELKANEERKFQYEVVKPLGKGKFSTVYVFSCAFATPPVFQLMTRLCWLHTTGTWHGQPIGCWP